MRFAILGAGNVGGGLGTALARVGHDVVFGVRDPGSPKAKAALATAPGATAAVPTDAVAHADAVIFALRWDAVAPTVAQLPALDGRIVIDAMNRLSGDPARSTAQDLAGLLPGARIVKAFNTIGFENLTTARERHTRAAMFVASDDADAKAAVMALAGEIGFEAEDAGPLTNAKALEEMVKVWLALTKRYGRGVGFAISKD
jgi:hypothetical protein